MNKKQKVVIWVGLGLILLSGLFPAFEGEWRRGGDNLKKYLGYYFIFSSPNSINVAKAFSAYYERLDKTRFSASIITSRFFIQIVTILLLMIGLVFLFADPKYEKKFPINKKDV